MDAKLDDLGPYCRDVLALMAIFGKLGFNTKTAVRITCGAAQLGAVRYKHALRVSLFQGDKHYCYVVGPVAPVARMALQEDLKAAFEFWNKCSPEQKQAVYASAPTVGDGEAIQLDLQAKGFQIPSLQGNS